jgi:hypothetical protein
VTVVEWFEREQRPAYTFRLSVILGQDDAWTSNNRGELVRVANGSKNAHTKLERIEYLRRMATAMVYVGGVSRRRRTLRVGEIPAVSELRSSGFVYVGAILKGKRTLRIGPRPS